MYGARYCDNEWAEGEGVTRWKMLGKGISALSKPEDREVLKAEPLDLYLLPEGPSGRAILVEA